MRGTAILTTPPPTIRRRNPRQQGEIGLGAAIGWFTAAGYIVSVPLCDNQPYDLVVDDGGRLQKVQVKTATGRSPRGAYVVRIATSGGDRSGTTVKLFDAAATDLLFVLADDRRAYLIPCTHMTATTTLTLEPKYGRYRVVGAGFEPA